MALPTARVPYEYLLPAEKATLQLWLTTHHIDPRRTPLEPLIEHDPVHDEWRIEQYWTDANGRMRIVDDENVRRVIVRRRHLAPLPWPMWEHAHWCTSAECLGDCWDRIPHLPPRES
jgi:hypothetical protein